jgi:hypothetical protein
MPEVPIEHAEEEIQHHAHGATEPWIMGVALTAAILAALAAVTSLLGEYHANEALLKQIEAADQWSLYQAKGIKAGNVSTRVEIVRALGKTPSAADIETLDRYKHEQETIREEAEDLQAASHRHLKRHIPLACGVTMFQVAIAVGAISVLSRKKPFWLVAIAFGIGGVGFLIAGLVV